MGSPRHLIVSCVWPLLTTTLGRQLAIKILPGAFAPDPERLARFEREAKRYWS